MRNSLQWSVNTNESAASLLRAAPIASLVFRCDRCDGAFPESQHVEQDGKQLCRAQCMDPISPLELDKMIAEAEAKPDIPVVAPFGPVTPATEGAVGITGFDAALLIVPQGSTGTLTIDGLNLSSADSIVYSGSGLSTSSATYNAAETQLVLIVAASGGAAKGYRDFRYADSLYKNKIFVS